MELFSIRIQRTFQLVSTAFIKTFAERESILVVSFSFHQQNVFDGRLMRA